MNAPIVRIESAAEKREERRRIQTLQNMRATFHALGIELGRIETLGDEERASALLGVRSRLAHVDLNALSLLRESLELARSAPAEESAEG